MTKSVNQLVASKLFHHAIVAVIVLILATSVVMSLLRPKNVVIPVVPPKALS